jgi:hypothetical protein
LFFEFRARLSNCKEINKSAKESKEKKEKKIAAFSWDKG